MTPSIHIGADSLPTLRKLAALREIGKRRVSALGFGALPQEDKLSPGNSGKQNIQHP